MKRKTDSVYQQEHAMRLALRLAFLSIALICLLQIVAVSAQENGYTYTVQPGDSWPLVAQRVGLTVSQLQEANPESVRPNGWLIVGERLFIPNSPRWKDTFYIVQRGDGWISVAGIFGMSVTELQAANPKQLRPDNALIVGERLLIPALLPTPTEEGLPVAPLPEGTQVAGEESLTREPTSEPAPLFMPRISLPVPTPVTLPPCPGATNDLGPALTDLFGIPAANRRVQLASFLADCGADLKTLTSTDLNSDRVDDAVLVYTPSGTNGQNSAPADSRSGSRSPSGKDNQEELVILSGGKAHSLSFAATANGTIELLATQDINGDNRTDVVWADTVCAANTCFLTVHVRSWDGVAWRDWTKGTITMASASVSLNANSGSGRVKEIHLTGGEYAGADAGPQRKRTAVWTSTGGAPYALKDEIFASSDCLYHSLIDANRAFTDERYLEKAQWLYTDVAENERLKACWKRPGELSELRSFALFRLAVIMGYQGNPIEATALVQRMEDEYGDQIYAGVARRWLDNYLLTGDPRSACKVVGVYAEVMPGVVDILVDYGYANPTFAPEDVCPILELAPPEEPEPTLVQIEGLPDCPSAVTDYRTALPAAANLASTASSGSGDQQDPPESIATWLRSCDALSDERGGLLFHDLNWDGLRDLIAAPAITGAGGYGRNGTEGVLLILHQLEDGSFQTAYDPKERGEPKLLALGDANGDGQPDLVWQRERCTTYCLLHVEVITWDRETGSYRSILGTDATIAEGTALVDVASFGDTTLPQIRRLWLRGGVSGMDEDGLAVSRTEIWYSIDGSPLRRYTWSYDRTDEASNCLGLRLIEANVALQAAGQRGNPSGYATAIEMYREILELPSLKPCSTQGTDPEEEMELLRGLANFRLVQALTLNDERPEAEALLESLAEEQPENRYGRAARSWLTAYYSVPNPVAACAAVMSVFLDSPELWQITEEFGDDHPGLNFRQVCHVPGSGEQSEFRLTPNW
ncbi:MAG: LysM peptidoglycan-binding domain-containing protein [Caldilineaceae bacterium]|nr:LysM peptidoglycan-binding domain-containing protein [Caldilineaceae bacterium]